MSSSRFAFFTLNILTILIIVFCQTPNPSIMDDRFYVDVPPGSRQYASLIKATQKALNQRVVQVNVQKGQDVPFRKIIRVVAVKTVKDIADAGFNRVRVIAAPTNCTLGQIVARGSRSKCSLDEKAIQQDCKVSIQYNYFPHLRFNPGPKTNIQCLPVKKS